MRIALFLLLSISLLPLTGQESILLLPTKHQITFGGSVWGNSSREDDSDNRFSRLSIQPYALIQIDHHWQFGLCATYYQSKQTREFVTSTPINFGGIIPFRGTIIDFGGGPIVFQGTNPFVTTTSGREESLLQQFGFCAFGRFTFNPEQRLNIFIEPAFNFLLGKQSTESSAVNQRFANDSFNRYADIGGRAGIGYRFSEHWRVNARIGAVGYMLNWNKEDAEDRYDLGNTGFFYSLGLDQLQLAIEFTL